MADWQFILLCRSFYYVALFTVMQTTECDIDLYDSQNITHSFITQTVSLRLVGLATILVLIIRTELSCKTSFCDASARTHVPQEKCLAAAPRGSALTSTSVLPVAVRPSSTSCWSSRGAAPRTTSPPHSCLDICTKHSSHMIVQ